MITIIQFYPSPSRRRCSPLGPGGLFFVFSALEHQAEQAFSALRPEIPDKYVFLHIRRGAILKEVDKEVRLHEDLLIHSVNVVVGMVVSHEIADAVNDLLRPGKRREHRPCLSRTFHLLIFSGIPSIFLFCLVNSDIMNDRCGLQDLLGVWIEVLQVRPTVWQTMHL